MKTKKTFHKRDMEFLFEIGSLRFIERTWRRFLNLDGDNLTEHHFRVLWIALMIAKYEEVKDTAKLVKMAIVHDLAESRTGDADYLSRQYVVRNEELGIKDILKGTAIEEEFLGLWEEYEKRESVESKIIKDADNLAVDFEIREFASRGYEVASKATWRGIREFVASERLYTKTAKRIWQDLQKADPHDWHILGRNRFKAGDWKKK